jgi:hypothetical protein
MNRRGHTEQPQKARVGAGVWLKLEHLLPCTRILFNSQHRKKKRQGVEGQAKIQLVPWGNDHDRR